MILLQISVQIRVFVISIWLEVKGFELNLNPYCLKQKRRESISFGDPSKRYFKNTCM